MILRRDHIAGGLFVVAAATVLEVSGDLPIGSMAMPGAGMLPKLVLGLMIAFGLILMARAGESPPVATVPWTDLPHAIQVVVLTAVAVALYTLLGFIITMSLLLFSLLVVVERRSFLRATAFSVGVTVFAYFLFGTLLKSPLPHGLLGF
jgi:Tripartite tricarboxylate transporter TctB family